MSTPLSDIPELSFQSLALGVEIDAKAASRARLLLLPSRFLSLSSAAAEQRLRFSSLAWGVVTVANFTACSSEAACFLPSSVLPVASIFSVLIERPPLGVHGDGTEVQSLSDVRSTRAVCAQYGRRKGVALRFHVS